MAGNSKRPGATRKTGSKKGMQVGSGGQRRKALEGRGPTPKAEDRTYHVAHKRKVEAEKRAQAQRPQQRTRKPKLSGPPPGKELIAGRNSVVEAARGGVPLTALYFAAGIDHDERTRELMQHAAEHSIPVFETSRLDLDQRSGGLAHQGVVAETPAYEYHDVEDILDAAEAKGHAPLIVALDSVTDPRNLGAILRSAAAFGADGVIVPERRAAGVTAAAWKVSAGAAARVPVARVTNLTRALQDLKRAGCFVVGLDGNANTDVATIHLAVDPLVLVVGSEGKGLSRLIRETCDLTAAIPISGAVESLNAGVAAAIALYEISRTRAKAASE
ncbi:MAG: 23S rRNA (guanosine(2251)-2'-O)-methyltransferase RlmB [Cellulomonadaceae bacterium]|jgi:23S rRNA (guanosine2251-2'-O)-methyltransferase|nr:23S rRNA (guanosine(2251)-2'-O)-methyltransferase RlmB [Cellulomonadaceae bacterium]